MFAKLKQSVRFYWPRNSQWKGRKKTPSCLRLMLETLEDRLAPAVAGTVHFAVIGDYGLAGPNERAVATLVKSWKPDFIVTVGGNNYPAGSEGTIDQNVGQYYGDYICPYASYNPTYPPGATTNMFSPVLGDQDWEALSATAYL